MRFPAFPFGPTVRNRSLAELVRRLSVRQLTPLWIGIFSTFASLGFIMDVMARGRSSTIVLALNVVASGAICIAYVSAIYTATTARRRRVVLLAVIAVHFSYVVIVNRLFHGLPETPPRRFFIDGFGAMVTVIVGYTFFIHFINTTASRYLRAQAEIGLARDIHRVLVPAIDRRIHDFDFFGWSLPSGDVGGDLVDVVERDCRWFGYIADVSGHGVGAGVVMGMFKSALRTRLLAGGSIGALLDDLNHVLIPLKPASTYVTVACISGGADGRVDCAVAGHLPILRVRDGEVEEVTSPQLAVGMFDDARFDAAGIDCRPGDLLALLTDGLVEVFDAGQRELGLDWAKRMLARHAEQPLSTIAGHLLAGARAHGAQLDDQTVLLVRRVRRELSSRVAG